MIDEPLLVDGCPLCKIYKDTNPKLKIYWPLNKLDINKSEFVIVECEIHHIPKVIYKDHVSTITREAWGRILYRCKSIFGKNIMLKTKYRTIEDHYHCYVVKLNEVY